MQGAALIGAFRFPALQAVILNKAMSLVVVASALPFRAAAVPFGSLAASSYHCGSDVVGNLVLRGGHWHRWRPPRAHVGPAEGGWREI